MEKQTTVLAHNAQFHADDIFAVATLAHLLGGLSKIKIVRTRDETVIAETTAGGGFVVDVGAVHDPSLRRFDHHQPGGAGVRQNGPAAGIPYAAFGLVWKEYGEKICNSKTVAEKVDSKLVVPIDADDNGFSIVNFKFPNVLNYRIQEFLYSFSPTWKENLNNGKEIGDIHPHKITHPTLDKIFGELVEIAYGVLEREIKIAADLVEGETLSLAAYQTAVDKRIIVLDGDYPWEGVIGQKTEPLFVIYPEHGAWRAKAVQDEQFKNRKSFPASWAGLRSEELAKISGVPDAIFCHNKLFTIAARSKKGAMAMVKIALDN